MNIQRWLLTPWIAAHRSARWAMGFILLLSTLGCTAFLIFHNANIQLVVVTTLLSVGVALMWMLFLPNMLTLDMDAKRLCLPCIRRDIIASLCLYVVLTTLIPALVLACFGASFLTCLVLLMLTGAVALLFALLPQYLAIILYFTAILYGVLPKVLHAVWAAPGDPGFLAWAAPLIAVLVTLAALRWAQVTMRPNTHAPLWRRPLIFTFNRTLKSRLLQKDLGYFGGSGNPQQWIRQRPDWLQPRADLRRTGPDYPQRALRVALGGSYLPQTWRSRLIQFIPVVAVLLIAAVAHLATTGQAHPWQALVFGHGSPFAQWFFALICVITVAATCSQIQRAWNQVNAELPLLALLPGFSDAARTRRELLRAVLTRPLISLALIMILMLALALASRQSPVIIGFVLLAPLGCAALALTALPGIIGGWARTPRGHIELPVMLSTLFVLTSIGTLLPGLAFQAMSAPARLHASVGLLLLWLLFALRVAYIGQRGWRALMRRPHPFLGS